MFKNEVLFHPHLDRRHLQTATGVEAAMSVLEPSLTSNFLPLRIAALHSALYCLERCPINTMKIIVDLLASTLPGFLVNAST